VYRFLLVAFCAICCCHQQVKCPILTFSDINARNLPAWKCHQVYSIRKDSATGSSFLEVASYPKNPYPGFELPWALCGDWTGYRSLEFVARMRSPGSARLSITVWDGKGAYEWNNRAEETFAVDTNWTTCTMSLKEGLIAPNGRILDRRFARRVVLFTPRKNDVTTFDLMKVELER
jgi:hypothetical protein